MKYTPTIPKQNTATPLADYSPIKDDAYTNEKNYIDYDSQISLTIPEFDYVDTKSPTPEEDDYKKGYFVRYFLMKKNEDVITEVTNEIYNGEDLLFDSKLYSKFELKWKLTGALYDNVINGMIIEYGIINTNKRSVNVINDKYHIRLDRIIRNYAEFSRF